jgi:hypothetical protein
MSYPSNQPNPFAPPGNQPQPPPAYPAPAQQHPQQHPQQPPQQPAYPHTAQDPQVWAQVQQPGYAGQQPGGVGHQPFTPAPKGGNGLAITAIVISGLALLAVLGMAVFLGIGAAMGGSYVLSGKVTVVDKGASYSALQDSLVAAIEDDGGAVDEVVCPERSQVAQGLVTVCHGSVDGYDWTGVVVFEDDEGTFIVTEY